MVVEMAAVTVMNIYWLWSGEAGSSRTCLEPRNALALWASRPLLPSSRIFSPGREEGGLWRWDLGTREMTASRCPGSLRGKHLFGRPLHSLEEEIRSSRSWRERWKGEMNRWTFFFPSSPLRFSYGRVRIRVYCTFIPARARAYGQWRSGGVTVLNGLVSGWWRANEDQSMDAEEKHVFETQTQLNNGPFLVPFWWGGGGPFDCGRREDARELLLMPSVSLSEIRFCLRLVTLNIDLVLDLDSWQFLHSVPASMARFNVS